MADTKVTVIALFVVIVIVIGATWFLFQQPTKPEGGNTSGKSGSSVSGGEATGPTFASQIVILRETSPKSLDPAKTTWTNDYGIIANIYSTLVGYKRGTRDLVPDLAESWEVSSDGLIYTFHLRHGVQWQKGWGEFTSEDVKFTFDRILNPNISVIYKSLFSSVKSVDAVDKYTVRFVLSHPDPAFLYVLAPYRNGFIICKAYYKSLEDPETQYGKNPVGTGPYQFVYWNEETGEVKLTAFKDYYAWTNALHVKDIIYKPIEDDDLRFNAFVGGEADVYSISDPEKLSMLENLQSQGKVQIIAKTGIAGNSLIFDTQRDLFLRDIRIRQAFAYAINKTYIVRQIMGGMAVEAVGWLPKGGYLYATNDVPQYPYNLSKARQLVNEFKSDKGYKDINVEFYLPNAFPFVQIAEYVQSQLSKVGVTVNLHAMDFSSWYDVCVVKGITNMTYLPLGGRPPEPSIILKTVFSANSIPPNGINFARYKGVDPLINQAIKATSNTERADIYRKIQVTLMKDLPIYPLYYDKLMLALNPDVKNFTIDNFNTYGDWMEFVYIKGATSGQVIKPIFSSLVFPSTTAVSTALNEKEKVVAMC